MAAQSLPRCFIPASVYLLLLTGLFQHFRSDQAALFKKARDAARMDANSTVLASIADDLKKLKNQAAAQGRVFDPSKPDEIEAGLAALRGLPLADFQKIVQEKLKSKPLSGQADALLLSGSLREAEAKSLEAALNWHAGADPYPEAAAIDYRRAGLSCYYRGDYRAALAPYRQALTFAERRSFPQIWALLQHDLATASHELGLLTETEEGNQLLLDAVAAYHEASSVRTRIKMPQEWAETQSSMGAALMERDHRDVGKEGWALLSFAEDAFQNALDIYTANRKARPTDPAAAVQWARAQLDLGKALVRFGGRVEDLKNAPFPGPLLEQAVAAFRAALEVYTREALPQEWAMTQHHLGGALKELARNGRWENWKRFQEEAAVAYRMALEVRTREAQPEQWAETKNSLGNDAMEDLNQVDFVRWERRPLVLEEALSAYRAALEVRTREALPRQWAETQNSLGLAMERQGDAATVEKRRGLWEEARHAFLAALEVRTEGEMLFEHLRTMQNLKNVQQKLGEN